MKHLKKFELYDELEWNVVNYSDLDDNWSSEYHLSKELEDIKQNYKLFGKKGFIKKIVDIVKKVDESTFIKLMKQSSKKFNINLPNYQRAIDEKYWSRRFGQISTLIIIMGALTSGLEVEKEQIREEIVALRQKLYNLESI